MFLTRWRTPQPPPVPELLNEPDPDLLLAYLTLGGAHVELLSHDFTVHRYCWCEHAYEREHAEPGKKHARSDEHGFRVWCAGCGQLVPKIGAYHDRTDFCATELRDAREAANDHAGRCRALPSRLVRPARTSPLSN